MPPLLLLCAHTEADALLPYQEKGKSTANHAQRQVIVNGEATLLLIRMVL